MRLSCDPAATPHKMEMVHQCVSGHGAGRCNNLQSQVVRCQLPLCTRGLICSQGWTNDTIQRLRFRAVLKNHSSPIVSINTGHKSHWHKGFQSNPRLNTGWKLSHSAPRVSPRKPGLKIKSESPLALWKNASIPKAVVCKQCFPEGPKRTWGKPTSNPWTGIATSKPYVHIQC